MPAYTVVVRRGGQIELLTSDRAEKVVLAEQDQNLGEFHAENEAEAWRQLVTANPSIDGERRRLVINADSDAALAEQKAEFEQTVYDEAVKSLTLPDDTGPDEEVEEEVEEEDAETGTKRTVKRKVKRSQKKAKASKKKGH